MLSGADSRAVQRGPLNDGTMLPLPAARSAATTTTAAHRSGWDRTNVKSTAKCGVSRTVPMMVEILLDLKTGESESELTTIVEDFVWRLTGTDRPPARSTCQAGYKGLWSAEDGFPSRAFLRCVTARQPSVRP